MKVSEIMTSKHLVTITASSTVAEALARMRTTGIHQVPVLNGKKYAGMLSYREVLRRRSIRSNSKVETFMIKTAKVSPNSDMKTAVKLLRNSGLSALPVVEKGMLNGILSRTDILRNFKDIVPHDEISCAEVMSNDPVLIQEDEPINRALEKFRSLDVAEMPVVSKSGKYLGVLRADQLSPAEILSNPERATTGDLSGESEKMMVHPGSLPLKDLKVEPMSSIDLCAEIMVENKIRSVPVIDENGKVMGVVGASDIIDILNTGEKGDGILIQVSGLEAWDDDLYDILYFNASKFISRLPKMTGIKGGSMDFHVAKYHSEGRIKYSIRSRLVGGSINLSVNDYDWNFGKCMDKIIETYENRLLKRKEK